MSAAAPTPEWARRIRGVLLDAGNTLLWIDHARVARLIAAAGAAVTTAEVRRAEMRARPRLDPFLGLAPKRESPGVFRRHIALLLDELGVTGDVATAAAGSIAIAWPTLWVCPPDDAHDTIRTLRARGHRVGCLSNSDGKVDELLRDAGLLELLETVVDSGRVGVEKPDPRIFRVGARALGLSPDDVVYVGDLHALDILGPRAAGMHAVLLDPIGAWQGFDADRIASLSALCAWFPACGPSGT